MNESKDRAALRTIATQSVGPDWTHKQAYTFMRAEARQALAQPDPCAELAALLREALPYINDEVNDPRGLPSRIVVALAKAAS